MDDNGPPVEIPEPCPKCSDGELIPRRALWTLSASYDVYDWLQCDNCGWRTDANERNAKP